MLGGLAGDAEPGADLGPGVAGAAQAGDGLGDGGLVLVRPQRALARVLEILGAEEVVAIRGETEPEPEPEP